MHSLSNYKKTVNKKLVKKFGKDGLKKAQFFVLTGFVIASVFYLVGKWLAPYTIIDTSTVAMSEELFVFNNIKQEASRITKDSKSCEELVKNLEEYKHYVEEYAFKKLWVYFDYSIGTPCYEYDPNFPILIVFDIELRSERVVTKDRFYGFWPPGSAPP